MNKRVWIEEYRSVREPDFALLDRLEVVLGYAGLANSPGTEVNDLVSVLVYLGVEVRHARVSPVLANCRQDVTQDVGLGDCAVDVGDDEFVRVPPEEDVTLGYRRSLKTYVSQMRERGQTCRT